MLGREDLIAAARKLWGEPTSKNGNEWRFGSKGGRRIHLSDNPEELFWSDYETDERGGVVELCRRAGIGGGNEQQTNNGAITYDWIDQKNYFWFQVVKLPGHKFFQRRPDGKGGWISGKDCMKGVPHFPYRERELIGSDVSEPVYVCEGEKDCDNLAKLGFITTTNRGGAKKWRAEYSEALRDRDVIILPDNDEPGREHAAKVSAMLHGVAHSIKVLMLPGLGDKEDVSDWIARGGTADQMRKLVELLDEHKPETDETGNQRDWMRMVQRTASGEPLSNVTNALICLRNDSTLKSMLTYDKLLSSPMAVHSDPVPLTSDDITDIQERMQLAGLRRMSKEVCQQAIVRRAKETSYHPLLDAWNKLEWDGIERVGRAAITYLGAADTEYHREIVAMFLRQMVKRVYEPGCKADYMLILEGEQGRAKSRFCEVLAGGPRYFSDCCPDLDKGKEVSQHLRGKILIEFAEMNLYSRADINHHKEFLTRTHERYRPPYEPAEVDEPRQCTFIGTSNKTVYLRDETGNRRYWGLTIGKIDIDALIRDRDQIIAEAIDDYRRGLPTFPNAKLERDVIEPEQEARYEDDPWLEQVSQYLVGLKSTTIVAIATASSGLDMPVNRVDNAVQARVSRILRKLQWISKRTKTKRWWEPMQKDTIFE